MVNVKINRHTFEVAMSKHNLSHRELADRMGFSRTHLSCVVNGKREPSPFLRRLIMEHLPGYTFDDLFTIEENGNDRAND